MALAKKLFPSTVQPSFAEKPWGQAQAQNFTLFAIEEKIAVQIPKNIARRAKIQLDE